MKSFAYGPFGFNKKFNYEKGLANLEHKHEKAKAKNKFLINSDNNKKFSLKRMRSSIVVNNSNLTIPVTQNKPLYSSKSNVLKVKQPVQRIKSLDERSLFVSKERKKINKLKKEDMDQVVTRKYSDKSLKTQLISKIKGKMDKWL